MTDYKTDYKKRLNEISETATEITRATISKDLKRVDLLRIYLNHLIDEVIRDNNIYTYKRVENNE